MALEPDFEYYQEKPATYHLAVMTLSLVVNTLLLLWLVL